MKDKHMGYQNHIVQGLKMSENDDFNREHGTCSRRYSLFLSCNLKHCMMHTELRG
jgi:hypothetical protein